MSKARAEEIDTDEEGERMTEYTDMLYSLDEYGRPIVQFVDADFWNDFGEHFDEDDWS